MPERAESFVSILDRRTAAILDACTRCGKCVEVCPTPALTGIDGIPAEDIVAGVVDILQGADGSAEAIDWAQSCCGSGACIDACPESIDPRFMLTMTRRTLGERKESAQSRAEGRMAFRDMSRGVRTISRLQLPPDVLARLNPPAGRRSTEGTPDIVFYTGCNLLKTPHIGLLCLDVLDCLGTTYEVMGGPGNCCGILQFRPGDTDNAGRQIMTTMERFRAMGASNVIAWCPTCQIQFGEVTMPGMSEPVGFDMTMWPIYLAGRLEELSTLMTERVEKRVAVCEFPGARGVPKAVQTLLQAIPGVTFVDLGLRRAGYQLSSLGNVADYRNKMLVELFQAAEAAGVTTLCSVFHADHRELTSHQDAWPFEIVNYMDVLGESLGLRRSDLFKRLKLMRDADAIVAEQAETLAANGLDLEEARSAVLAYILGEQLLPVDPAEQTVE